MTARFLSALDPSKVADLLGLRDALTTGRNDGLASMTRTAQSMIREMLSGGEKGQLSELVLSTRTMPAVADLLSGGVNSSVVALNLLKLNSVIRPTSIFQRMHALLTSSRAL